MAMSEYSDFPIDFLKRTQVNLENYSGNFEVTNLINNCLGLIVLPKELLIDSLNGYIFTDSRVRYGISKTNIKFERDNDFTLKNVIRHIRNGLSHGRIEQKSSNGVITGVRIFDCSNIDSPENFSIELSIDELKNLALKFSSEFIV